MSSRCQLDDAGCRRAECVYKLRGQAVRKGGQRCTRAVHVSGISNDTVAGLLRASRGEREVSMGERRPYDPTRKPRSRHFEASTRATSGLRRMEFPAVSRTEAALPGSRMRWRATSVQPSRTGSATKLIARRKGCRGAIETVRSTPPCGDAAARTGPPQARTDRPVSLLGGCRPR